MEDGIIPLNPTDGMSGAKGVTSQSLNSGALLNVRKTRRGAPAARLAQGEATAEPWVANPPNTRAGFNRRHFRDCRPKPTLWTGAPHIRDSRMCGIDGAWVAPLARG